MELGRVSEDPFRGRVAIGADGERKGIGSVALIIVSGSGFYPSVPLLLKTEQGIDPAENVSL